MNIRLYSLVAMVLVTFSSCGQKNDKQKSPMANTTTDETQLETATFGSGCFWCTEAIFLNVDGVHKVESGYAGGKVKNPTYKEVCSGLTGHAEVIQVKFDPKTVTYEELLEIFWKTHDPTTLNRQGADIGTQYRSVIFYHSDEQKRLAEHYKQKLEENKVFDDPVVTEISPITAFYKAEDYHQNYYNLNPSASYCSYVIQPKLEKFKKVFSEKLKK
jgi:peptide-methionine (S)-S-oxide reductase